MTPTPPESLARLLERYDPSAIDVPGGNARVRLAVTDVGRWDVVVNGRRRPQLEPANGHRPHARIEADRATWRHIANDVRGGMSAWDRGKLDMRGSLHLGIGFLAATTGSEEEGRLEFGRVKTSFGNIATVSAGEGDPVLCLPGLGGTKASFMSTVAALADTHRVIAIDLPGFGDSVKPIRAPYDAPWFAKTVVATLDALHIDRADLIGNSMGGRVALETALRHPDRVERVIGLAPAVAWLSERRWAPLLKLVRPELGLIQPAPRAGEPHRAQRGARSPRGLGGRGRGRVPARLPRSPRPRRLLRGRSQHLPRRAPRRQRLLDPPVRDGARRDVRVGREGHARADRLPAPRGAVPAAVHARGAQLRACSAGGAARADAPRGAEVPHARAAPPWPPPSAPGRRQGMPGGDLRAWAPRRWRSNPATTIASAPAIATK